MPHHLPVLRAAPAIEYKNSDKQGVPNKQDKSRFRDKQNTRALLASGFACYYCNQDHAIYSCDQFLNLQLDKKTEFIKKKKLCFNCLRDNHPAKKCKMGPCRKCKSWHNTLLHPEKPNGSPKTESPTNSTSENEEHINSLSSGFQASWPICVLLSTAQVHLLDKFGVYHTARALLDCGSQSSFITQDICKKLNLDRHKVNLTVLGIGNAASRIQDKCNVEIRALQGKFKTQATCFIIPEITNISGYSNLNTDALNIPRNLKLADPKFLEPGSIDMLIGADLFWNILGTSKMSCGKNLPILQDTKLGCIISG